MSSVGDYIQWESQGMIQFQEPRRVRAFSPDGTYVFVHGSPTGMPVSEVTIEEPPAPPEPPIVPPTRWTHKGGGSANMRQDVFNLPEGGDVILSWPETIKEESLEDIKSWLETAQRKISRFIRMQEQQKDESPE